VLIIFRYQSIRYGRLETVSRIFLHQEAGSECAEYPVDAVYAWDQPDIYLYVSPGVDLHDHQVVFFQATLGVVGRGAGGQELQDAAGGVGGGVAALAEECFEVAVVVGELLLAAGVVEQVVEFPLEVLRGEFVLDQFFDDEFVHDKVDEGDVFHPDQSAGYLVGDGAAFVADDFGHAEEGGFEGRSAGGDAGCPCGEEE
jgi:hypothetical protein